MKVKKKKCLEEDREFGLDNFMYIIIYKKVFHKLRIKVLKLWFFVRFCV